MSYQRSGRINKTSSCKVLCLGDRSWSSERNYLVTRIPCALPDDVVALKATAELGFRPKVAYENLAVMSAHDDLEGSLASHMSGGACDGDITVIIGSDGIVKATPRPNACDDSDRADGVR